MFLKLTCDLRNENIQKLLTTPVPDGMETYNHEHLLSHDGIDNIADLESHAEIVEILERNHDAKFYEHPNGAGLIINPCAEDGIVTLMFQMNDGDEFDMILTEDQKKVLRDLDKAFGTTVDFMKF